MHTSLISRRQFTLLGSAALLSSQYPQLALAQTQGNTMPALKTVTLPDGSQMPALGMGSWHLAAGRRPLAEEQAALNLGLSLGMRLIDTAEMYSNGASEQLVARVIADKRQEVFVVSKISPQNALSERSIRHSCERSLRNLNTHYMDMYLLHWPAGVKDLQTVVATFEALKQEGKIRHWGVSNFNVKDMQRLYSLENGKNCATNQVRYSLSDRSIETLKLPEWSEQNRMPLMAYSPLGSGGSLLGNPLLAEVAKKHQSTPAAIAIAWTIRNGWTISIPESGNINHIKDNASAAAIALDQDDLNKLDAAFPARYISHWSGA
ncbi:aldo/keto reductase [Ventosimonas gracilis]|nr:aldo/keto reductase [Ventosimonas gracilis]